MFDIRGKVIDLRYVLSHGNKYQQGKLGEYAEMIGLKAKYNGYNGGDAVKLWEANNLSELREYVLNDVQITFGVYQRLKDVGLL